MVRNWIYFAGGVMVSAGLLISIAGTDGKKDVVLNHPAGVFEVPKLSENLNFAGEIVPVAEKEVFERLDREVLVNTYWHSNTILMLKRANKFFPVIEPILRKNGVPDDFKYLCMIESGLANVVSPSDAAGFWQFLPTTGKKYGLEVNTEVDERYNLVKATEAACKYLNDNKVRLGSWTLAAAAYNMGENGVERQLKGQGVSSYYDLHLNPETARYLFRILAAKEIHTRQAEYGFVLQEASLYAPIKTREIVLDSAVANWPEFALEQGTNYKYLKILNPWIRERSMKNKLRKIYYVSVPADSKEKQAAPELEPGADE